MKLINRFIKIFLILLSSSIIMSQEKGKVYLVIGSDTAIWDGMSTSRYNCAYRFDLYSNPDRNAYKVFDPEFREPLKDSYGNTIKFTWWMMAGNIFRYAINRNVPVPNIMTLYLIKKYHGDRIEQFGDELSLHYHTFIWSDFNGDGKWYWNQAKRFLDCKEDFDFTLAQFLLEENVFPVSFRSGWHYMDNDWQAYLNKLLPYSLHNDYPAKGFDDTEPIDNIMDWSLAPSDFIPYHPSPDNYQIPGDSPGWNVRSAHFFKVRACDLMDTIFYKASLGQDQLACIWGHLPETDFLDNVVIIDSLAHKMEEKYPGVMFRYCTAVEAYRLYRNSNDITPPELNISEIYNDGKIVGFEISSNELIFQESPIVAIKDIYENYYLVELKKIGNLRWKTKEFFEIEKIAKVGISVCDTVGNQTNRIINFLPDDIFIDDSDANFQLIGGSWTEYEHYLSWNGNFKLATVTKSNPAIALWTFYITMPHYYNIYALVPDIDRKWAATYYVYNNETCIDTIRYTQPIRSGEWLYLTTQFLEENCEGKIELEVSGEENTTLYTFADAIKISPLVKDKELYVTPGFVDFGLVSEGDTVYKDLLLENRGIQPLKILNITSANGYASCDNFTPFSIPALGDTTLKIGFSAQKVGVYHDTLIVESDAPNCIKFYIPVSATVELYSVVIDNEDSQNYSEIGEWRYSVAQAYGPTSRYAWLNQKPLAQACFRSKLKKEGIYEIFEIVPTTENATDKAIYKVCIEDSLIDSVEVDQNIGSGNWVSLGQYHLPNNTEIKIKVCDSGRNTRRNAVLRADAIKFKLIHETTRDQIASKSNDLPSAFSVKQNYPNPVNSITTVEYFLPSESFVNIFVYDIAGRLVESRKFEKQPAGTYKYNIDVFSYSSGIYIYTVETVFGRKSVKMIVVK
ncbi:MAG: hypothetical protein DRP88_07300 [Candidatus Neomarinimicrobiota bacterium]|nr:MAG: hypothetical protein DRP88_07300 [Candidatus Neomarinimicrobiota bacterium]